LNAIWSPKEKFLEEVKEEGKGKLNAQTMGASFTVIFLAN